MVPQISTKSLKMGYMGTMQLLSKTVHHNCSEVGGRLSAQCKTCRGPRSLPRMQCGSPTHRPQPRQCKSISRPDITCFQTSRDTNTSFRRTALYYSQLLPLSPNGWYSETKRPERITFSSSQLYPLLIFQLFQAIPMQSFTTSSTTSQSPV